MITPEAIRKKALQFWEGPYFLRSVIEGNSFFPLEISFAKPSGRILSSRFAEIKAWLNDLRAQSKQNLGYGYSIVFAPVSYRLLGDQVLPQRIVIEMLEDLIRLTGKQKQWARFTRCLDLILKTEPSLKNFLAKDPHLVLTYADSWERLLIVCRYFAKNPKPYLYLRQLDIEGVDTKFIETHFKILADLLDHTLPDDAVNRHVRGFADHGFEKRFGLRYAMPCVRLRLLDGSLAIEGLMDLTVPIVDLQRLIGRGARRVFIVENKTNGLCFPDFPEGVVIFGLGYSVDVLAAVEVLNSVDIFYWGDIDTHGFAILDRLRGYFPKTRSFLMDKDTLCAFKSLWTRENSAQRFHGTLNHLTDTELAFFKELSSNSIGECLRLEQERIAYGYLQTTLEKLLSSCSL